MGIDNKALYSKVAASGVEFPTYGQLNSMIAEAMALSSLPLRRRARPDYFPASLLSPGRRLLVPAITRALADESSLDFVQLLNDCLLRDNFLLSVGTTENDLLSPPSSGFAVLRAPGASALQTFFQSKFDLSGTAKEL